VLHEYYSAFSTLNVDAVLGDVHWNPFTIRTVRDGLP
jgi:hypothetical protein